MTTQELTQNIENRVNEQLNKFDLCKETGDLNGMAEAAEKIEELMGKLNENRITLIISPKDMTGKTLH